MPEGTARRTRILLGTLVTTLLIVVDLALNVFFDRTLNTVNLPREYETRLFDFRLRAAPKLDHDPRIVIAAIDDASLRQIRHWPWPRATLAHALAESSAGRPKAIGVDIVFAEPEPPVTPELRDALRRHRGKHPAAMAELERYLTSNADDCRLARTIADAGNVVLAAYLNAEDKIIPRIRRRHAKPISICWR